MSCLITGVTGQDGRLLAQHLLQAGEIVFGSSRSGKIPSDKYFLKLCEHANFSFLSLNLEDFHSVRQALDTIQVDEVYHLSGQSSVGRSFVQPYDSYVSNISSTLNLLEAIRCSTRSIKILNAVSSDVFGECLQPAHSRTEHKPISPYAQAKSTSANILESYRCIFGLFAVNAYLFNHESIFRSDQFVTHKIVHTARKILRKETDELVLGNTEIIRDWGWAPEIVTAFPKMLRSNDPFDLTIGTGSSISLMQFGRTSFDFFGLKLEDYLKFDQGLVRSNEILVSKCDTFDAETKIQWTADTVGENVAIKLATSLCDGE